MIGITTARWLLRLVLRELDLLPVGACFGNLQPKIFRTVKQNSRITKRQHAPDHDWTNYWGLHVRPFLGWRII